MMKDALANLWMVSGSLQKDQTIKDIGKAIKMPKSHHNDLGDLDPTPPPAFDTQAKYDRTDDASNADDTGNLNSSVDDVESVPVEFLLGEVLECINL